MYKHTFEVTYRFNPKNKKEKIKKTESNIYLKTNSKVEAKSQMRAQMENNGMFPVNIEFISTEEML